MKQKRLRSTTWEDYGISKYRYHELKNFCLQYPEKIEMVSNGRAHPRYIKDCSMIEEAAQETSTELYPWIMASVTEGSSYDELEAGINLERVPICKQDFYGYRRKFYWLLHEMILEN